MSDRGYLLSYGRVGDFGRFESAEPFRCRRGDRVVVRTARGQEIGVVMRAVSEGHALLLADRPIGQMMCLATPGDEGVSYACMRGASGCLPTHVATLRS